MIGNMSQYKTTNSALSKLSLVPQRKYNCEGYNFLMKKKTSKAKARAVPH